MIAGSASSKTYVIFSIIEGVFYDADLVISTLSSSTSFPKSFDGSYRRQKTEYLKTDLR